MTKSKKAEQEKINEFLEQTKDIYNKDDADSTKVSKQEPKSLSKPYRCPSCHRPLASRKEPCKHCGYKGYIPLSDEQIKKTKFVLFFVILAAAIAVYILTR
ncbi:MAG: hypothetical protein WC152_07380 [Candidatus Izemoplasmatales bacterium]